MTRRLSILNGKFHRVISMYLKGLTMKTVLHNDVQVSKDAHKSQESSSC